ncbi:hypothetical protein Har1131_17275 [Haloarcula sp. CBA1131]|uniref:restriction endonuclease n=1 Tax=Haloarcula sp. CBA1131 TaxID=1853686 RepID=UPI00124745B3|nr:hypothetical protein Har1131_19120 [Haloarcula sp. CBA1131]KAA9404121.1 hypothetical protein Har1131_17275 [Haloarcula sp. CBA1131]
MTSWKNSLRTGRIEVRKENNWVGEDAVHRFATTAHHISADRMVFTSSSFFTNSARAAADELGIETWNGERTGNLFSEKRAPSRMNSCSSFACFNLSKTGTLDWTRERCSPL